MLNDQYLGLALAMIGGFLAGVALLLILMPRRREMLEPIEPPKPIPYASAIGSRPEAPWVTSATVDSLRYTLFAEIDSHAARLAVLEAAQKPGLPDGVRVWKRSGHVRLTTGDGVMWGRDGSGCWYTFVASEEWTRRRCTKLHGPEALAIYEDWKARKA